MDVEQGDRSRPEDQRRACDVDEKEHAMSRIAVAELGCERRSHHRGQDADETNQADRRHPALLVGEEREGDDEHPIRGGRQRPAQLHEPQRRIGKDGDKRLFRLP